MAERNYLKCQLSVYNRLFLVDKHASQESQKIFITHLINTRQKLGIFSTKTSINHTLFKLKHLESELFFALSIDWAPVVFWVVHLFLMFLWRLICLVSALFFLLSTFSVIYVFFLIDFIFFEFTDSSTPIRPRKVFQENMMDLQEATNESSFDVLVRVATNILSQPKVTNESPFDVLVRVATSILSQPKVTNDSGLDLLAQVVTYILSQPKVSPKKV